MMKQLVSLVMLLLSTGIIHTAYCQNDQKAEAALTQLMEGNFAQARKTITEVIGSGNGNGLAYAVRASTLIFGNELTAARSDAEKAVQFTPANGGYYAILADCYRLQNDAVLSKATAEKAIALLRSPKSGFEYFTRGMAYAIMGREDEALADYNKTIELSPRYVRAYAKRGIIYSDRKQIAQALADYSKCIAINPQYAFPYFDRGNIYLNQKNYDRAVSDYTAFIRLDPDYIDAYVNRGVAYKVQKKYDLAIADYTKALEINPKDIDAYSNRGNVYFIKREFDLALKDYKKTIELNPKSSNGYTNAGIVHHEKQQFNEAIAHYTRAIGLDPKNLTAYTNRADAYESIGNAKLAAPDRKKYIELGGKITPTGGSTWKALFPASSFDVALAKAALTGGLSTIRGRACSKYDGRNFYAAGAKVVLYPVTPYLHEWYDLREKKEGKNTGVYMSTEANQYRIETNADAEGRFIFQNLKPGRYFIQIIHSFNQIKTAKVYTGSDTYYQGPVRNTTNYYYNQDYLVARSKRLEKFVEIDEDGETKKITLTSGLIKSCAL